MILYLHGFASSSRSSKAAFFASKLRALGHELHTPDFNQPDFSSLTITRMIDQARSVIHASEGRREAPRSGAPSAQRGGESKGAPPSEVNIDSGEPVTLIGSSLGGFVAVQTALEQPQRIARLILLAPALEFDRNRLRDLGDRGVDEWKRTDRLDVFHYGYGRIMSVGYELFADAQRYDCLNAQLSMPIQVFQGRRDTAVDPATVERWSKARRNVELHLLDDDHQLGASLDVIWGEARQFLGIG